MDCMVHGLCGCLDHLTSCHQLILANKLWSLHYLTTACAVCFLSGHMPVLAVAGAPPPVMYPQDPHKPGYEPHKPGYEPTAGYGGKPPY